MPDLRVLVVDNDRDNADSLDRLLKSLGADSRCAYDGFTALQLAYEFDPQLALLDLGMPTIDGLRIAQQFRLSDSLKSARLVAITGFGDPKYRKCAEEAGFDEFVVKPYSIDQIQTILMRTTEQVARAKFLTTQTRALREANDLLREATREVVAESQETRERSRSRREQRNAAEPLVIEIGRTYWVRWAGEEFQFRVRGRGVNDSGRWVGSRLDTNKAMILPPDAFMTLSD